MAYTAAYYILDIMVQMGHNDSAVLVHGAGSTSVGQSLARLVLEHYNGTLLMTTTDGKEKQFLRDEVSLKQCAFLDPTMLDHDIKKTKDVGKHTILLISYADCSWCSVKKSRFSRMT